ncbi:related to iron-sulfur cluster assembly accessory protein Isa1, putative [Hanseniaspora guilliermondii]|uniref:Iron-sulfur assembly protein 1 n=1 Tax=Hanseniaspora guilliermondii TaxID=56406 RepID=A0A1L0CPI6_9ASCO|nr:related to iron-sulfur cluster assembly accessory protein Isa1, putative [Hanseniaspora guilliermondii]
MLLRYSYKSQNNLRLIHLRLISNNSINKLQQSTNESKILYEDLRTNYTYNKTSDNKWASYSLPSKETLQKQKELEKEAALKKEAEKATQTPTKFTRLNTNKKRTRQRQRQLKAPIYLLPNALKHLKELSDQPTPQFIKIGVTSKGCSGLSYDLQYVNGPNKFDEIVEQDGVKVIIDSKALLTIIGSEMDWIDDKLSNRFVFKNPNTKGTCGCGESFHV